MKGVWQVNIRYVKDDIVRFGGNVYRCIIGHTSNDGVREGIGSDLGDDNSSKMGINCRRHRICW